MPIPIALGIAGGSMAFLARVFFTFVAVDFIIKALVALGLGIISYNLGNWALDNLFQAMKSNFSGAPLDGLMLAELAGFSEAISIILGALSIRVTLAGINKAKFSFMPGSG